MTAPQRRALRGHARASSVVPRPSRASRPRRPGFLGFLGFLGFVSSASSASTAARLCCDALAFTLALALALAPRAGVRRRHERRRRTWGASFSSSTSLLSSPSLSSPLRARALALSPRLLDLARAALAYSRSRRVVAAPRVFLRLVSLHLLSSASCIIRHRWIQRRRRPRRRLGRGGLGGGGLAVARQRESQGPRR